MQSGYDVATNGETGCNTVPIRISAETKAELDRILGAIVRDGARKRVRADSVIKYALAKLKEQDLEELRSKSVTFGEVFDREFLQYKTDQGSITRDEFLGLVLQGKVKNKGLPAIARLSATF